MTTDLTVRGVCPLDCPDTCGWRVTLRDGHPAALRGDPDHPFTRGALCTKVNRYLEHTRAPDRLLYPLRRIGGKGEGRFTRISWEEALDEIAVRWRDVVDAFGGEAIWPYWGTGSLGYLQGLVGRAGRRLFNVLGASDHDMTICATAGSAGLDLTIGNSSGMDPELFSAARLILLWGTNTLTTGHHLWKYIQQARQVGALVVAIDPLRTRTARQADLHLAPMPGTDAALALGIMHVIAQRGAEDVGYLAAHTLGWDRLRERLEHWPPARVAAVTGLTETQIVHLGTLVAEIRPTAIRATMGLQRHAGGGMALRALACIPGVTGDWSRAGGGLSYATSAHFRLDKPALFRDDLRPHPVRTLVMSRLGKNLLTLDDPPVKALCVIAANPAASNPDQEAVRRGLAREDLFTVVIEHFPTDTVDYADIVLPATMQVEHADLHTGASHLYVAWNEPAVDAPGECLSTSETFRRLARRMGLTEPCLYDSDESLARQALASGDPSLEGITLDRLREEGPIRLCVPSPFLPFEHGFPTPSGRLEFWSERAESAGFEPLPDHRPGLEIADGKLASRFPFVLLATASHHFINTVFGNNAELRRRSGEPTVAVNPADAGPRGLVDGQPVRVHNDRGAFRARLEVGDWVRPGVAATTKGRWVKLTAGGSANSTVDERDTDLGNGPVFHDNRVAIDPA